MGYEGPEQYRMLLDAIKQVVIRSGAYMVFDEASDQLAARDQSIQMIDEASGQLGAKDQLTFQEEMGDTIVLEPLPGRTPLATTSQTLGMSEYTTQSTEPGIRLEREPRHTMPIATPSQEPGMSKDATQSDQRGMSLERHSTLLITESQVSETSDNAMQSDQLETDQNTSEDDSLTIHLAQPVKQPRGRE